MGELSVSCDINKLIRYAQGICKQKSTFEKELTEKKVQNNDFFELSSQIIWKKNNISAKKNHTAISKSSKNQTVKVARYDQKYDWKTTKLCLQK